MNKTWLCVLSLIGTAISGAALILLIPSLFRPGEHDNVWSVLALACLTAVFAVGTRRWRPQPAKSRNR
ncbi:hypothetical protein [Georgenia deserti]|uniref:Uncharacterized protein n=1 Tax=Georgenia deserti TaxID=2093781 RepID=A0ABW4L3X5_9MICO